MTLAPRFLVNFWAGFRVARFARRQKAGGHDPRAQRAVFAHLLGPLAKTEVGRAAGITREMTYEQFRLRVPPRTHADFQPAVARMLAGEENVLWPGRCRLFVETAGTTGEAARRLPVTGEMLAQYRAGLRQALFFYAARAGHSGVFLGRHLQVGESTALTAHGDSFIGNLDGLTALSLSAWVEANLHSPPADLAQLPAGAEKSAALGQWARGRDVTLVGGTPAAALALAHAARAAASTGKMRVAHLQTLWPNLECFLHTGAPLGLFAEELRASLGPTVGFHEIYAAAEGYFAAQELSSAHGLRLLADAGVFFEFLPLAEFQNEALARLGGRCLPLPNVQTGTDYVLLVTTPAGLTRCVVGDIVRFVAVDPYRLQVVGRTALQLNSFGERVGERELTETVLEVCQRNGWQAVNFHVAPLLTRTALGATRGAHEWWIELRPGTVKTPTAASLGPELDAALARRNSDYAAKRQSRGLDEPGVRLVIPGVFEQWARGHHALASASKMPRCRSDRLIADQLAALARFHSASQSPFVPPGNPPPAAGTRTPFGK
ncbi:MAG: GH3 auxin-responsive promoter family protein [Opitutae bacterium]|nr:GH3 auxin-responsive promoter family protein [Opitutae bacterium]